MTIMRREEMERNMSDEAGRNNKCCWPPAGREEAVRTGRERESSKQPTPFFPVAPPEALRVEPV